MIMEAVLRLFKGVPLTRQPKQSSDHVEALEKTIPYGFILSPEVIINYSDSLDLLIDAVAKEIGLSADQMNRAFHKSWQKVRDTPSAQLVIEQIVHYLTTYGAKSLGIYDQDTVYVPVETLEIPELDVDKLHLAVIHGYTDQELRDKLFEFLAAGIALKDDTVRDVVEIATYLEIDQGEVAEVKNKEVRVALYSYLNIFPEDPVEFLRFLVYRSINQTLLISNKDTFQKIRKADNSAVLDLISRYDDYYGLRRLAEIFYRFKPIFLAFRGNAELNHYINRIRKLAVKYHKPMATNYLNTLTANMDKVAIAELFNQLRKVNIFRKIRLAYALKFRTTGAKSILYRIRNGKGYAKEFEFFHPITESVLKVVLDTIIFDIAPQVRDKRIYIPENVVYALPATEKQFTGNFPSGSYITLPDDMIVGVHWNNVDGESIDLDLSMVNADIKIGWDGDYRSGDRGILFSGDLTDAPLPHGASESFYVKLQDPQTFVVFVNYYNFMKDTPVPFSCFVGTEEISKGDFDNYIINPNNVETVTKSKMVERQKILGLLTTSPTDNRFYFVETYIGDSITSGNTEFMKHSLNYLVNFYQNTINLNDILEQAGATIVTDETVECDIDLSPERIDKTTILTLLTPKPQKIVVPQ